jgi:hypothetical protein
VASASMWPELLHAPALVDVSAAFGDQISPLLLLVKFLFEVFFLFSHTTNKPTRLRTVASLWYANGFFRFDVGFFFCFLFLFFFVSNTTSTNTVRGGAALLARRSATDGYVVGMSPRRCVVSKLSLFDEHVCVDTTKTVLCGLNALVCSSRFCFDVVVFYRPNGC